MENHPSEIPAAFRSAADQSYAQLHHAHIIAATGSEPQNHEQFDEDFRPLGETAITPGDIDEILHQAVRIGTFVEVSWHWLNEAIKETNQVFAGAYIGKDPISGKIKTSRRPDAMTDALTDPNIGKLYAVELARGARKTITKENIADAARHLSDYKELESFGLTQSVAEEGIRAWEDAQAKSERAMHDSDVIDGVKYSDDMIAGYRVAFGAQQLFIDQLTNVFADDANVEPFVERLQEIIALRHQGINELPGLLETLNTLITQQEIEQQTSSFEAAIIRTGLFNETLDEFTHRVITQEAPALHGNIPKEFNGLLNGVKMSYQALVGSGRMTEDEFVDAFATQLSDITNGKTWREAHSIDAATQARTKWRSLVRDIRQYDRRGRLPDYLQSARQVVASGASKRKSANRFGRSKKASAAVAVSDLQDVATPLEEILVKGSLAVMKSRSSGTEHTLEYVDGIDALMEHTFVTNFLKRLGAAGMKDTVQSVLEFIQFMPAHYKTSRSLSERFTIDDEHCEPHRQFRMRRFKPSGDVIDLSDPLARRIRVLYGIVPSKIGTLITLKNVTLRNENTY